MTGGALCLALLSAGCSKKPARPVPEVLVPTIESQPEPAPLDSQNPADQNTQSQPTEVPANTPAQNAKKPKPKPHKPAPRKPVQPAPPVTEAPKPEPAKTITPDQSVQITADVPRAAVLSQKQNTEQLLRSSEGKLAHINHALSESEQGMLRQAHNYIAQSNQALQGGDIERAYNLAVKANLLSNELAK
jgi:outer membrane biosynthesis protein TonB